MKVIGTSANGNPLIELEAGDVLAIGQASTMLRSMEFVCQDAIVRRVPAGEHDATKATKKPASKGVRREPIRCAVCNAEFTPMRKDSKCCGKPCLRRYGKGKRYTAAAPEHEPKPDRLAAIRAADARVVAKIGGAT